MLCDKRMILYVNPKVASSIVFCKFLFEKCKFNATLPNLLGAMYVVMYTYCWLLCEIMKRELVAKRIFDVKGRY